MDSGAFLLALVAVLLIVAASTDIAYRIIPNWVSIAIAVSGAVARLAQGPIAVLISAGIALLAFAILLVLHARRYFGGGDVKLIAAVCLCLSPDGARLFIFSMAMSGGVLSLLHLAGRRLLRNWQPRKPPLPGSWLAYRVLRAEIWRLARHGTLPYGVAIACGGIFALAVTRGY
jgi:prepilin peptidase CpaA